MIQVYFIFSCWILIKQIIVSSTTFCCRGKQIFERILPGGIGNFLLPSAWWQILGGEFWVGRDMNKNASNQCIFYECELHKFENIFHTWWNIEVWEKIQQVFWRGRQSPREFLEIWKDVSLRLIVKDKGGNRDCLPFCWF